jgi:hypothetical protein
LRHQPEYNWLQQNRLFLKLVAFNLMPPVFFAINNYADPRLNKIQDKLKVILIMTVMRYVTVLELLRLKLGGVSTRE